MIVFAIQELVGRTPLLQVQGLARRLALPEGWCLYLKLESQNPGRSVKDRAGLALLDWFRRQDRKTLALESTSGNTGVGLALANLNSDIRLHVYVDTLIPRAKLDHMRMLGLEPLIIEITPDERQKQTGVLTRIAEIQRRCSEELEVIWLDQYGNSAYPEWQSHTLAPEIFDQAPDTSLVAASVGTGGTISGVAHHVRTKALRCRTIAVEPVGSAMFGFPVGEYQQRGSGNAFKTGNLWTEYIDEFVQVSDIDAAEAVELTASEEGIFVGDSSGAAIVGAARRIIASGEPAGCAVVIVSDCGIRYLRAPLKEKLRYGL